MMKKYRSLIFLLLVVSGRSWAIPSTLGEAERIVRTLRDTSYSHDIYIDERRGVYRVDCSGFANLIVELARPEAHAELEEFAKGKRPLAKDYVNILGIPHHGMHWGRVARVADLKLGDLVAWLVPPGSTSKDTGHVMFVAGNPTINPRNPNEWLIPVVDSASSGHGPADPRRKAGPNGVGKGIIGMQVNDRGEPLAFRWSGGTNAKFKATTIRLGRALYYALPKS